MLRAWPTRSWSEPRRASPIRKLFRSQKLCRRHAQSFAGRQNPAAATRRRRPDPGPHQTAAVSRKRGRSRFAAYHHRRLHRQNRYQEAAVGIEKSLQARTSLLNGFPAVNHGLAGCRQVTESVKSPIQVRHGTPDARLLAEITLAGGTSYEGGRYF